MSRIGKCIETEDRLSICLGMRRIGKWGHVPKGMVFLSVVMEMFGIYVNADECVTL